ncbi:hypothetical protein BT96DRAFT_142963 [Gymnopus androsaceus JB14]|uniref:Uncharacterized protein n=1 Tax=Gymnopus androsaceus JB14 TaxID=1447944 RepID=A0A6A4HCH6_9AGAR|nr:hypothetical protein BT96DRAFT_142963 [Gymnopus androsaceus JB14]
MGGALFTQTTLSTHPQSPRGAVSILLSLLRLLHPVNYGFRFGRKKSPKSSSSTRDQDEHVDVKLLQPRPPFPGRASTGAASESDAVDVRRNLGPPPSRSAIFSAYGDPHSANSTRSLPSEYPASVPTTETLVEPSVVTPKRPLFPWSSKSQPNTTKVKSKAKSYTSKSRRYFCCTRRRGPFLIQLEVLPTSQTSVSRTHPTSCSQRIDFTRFRQFFIIFTCPTTPDSRYTLP